MSRMEKNKGNYEFWIDGKAKPYILDVNNGKFLGLRGSAIQTVPSVVKSVARMYTTESSVMRLFYNDYNVVAYAALYSVVDKMDSIGYHPDFYLIRRYADELVKMDFRKFANWYQQNPAGDVENYLSEICRIEWAEKNGLRVDEHFTEDMLDYLYRRFTDVSSEHLKVFAYWLPRGLWDFFGNDRYYIAPRLHDMIEYSNGLETPLEKSDFFRQYINMRRDYFRKKDEIDNAQLVAYQNEHRAALSFENEDYIVVIPQTNEELRIEGQKQNNCVGGYGSAIRDKRRNVVFIRRKSNPNVPYITCDIMPNGYINQYLISCNRTTTEPTAVEFKKLYQAHLLEMWNKGE